MRILNNRRFSAEANGTSKKKAKQAAAEAFLYRIIYKFIEESLPTEQLLLPSKTSEQMIPQRNFIGLLQDFCHRWEIPQPTYSLAMEIEESQVFFCCKLQEREKIGSADNDETAKQIAAEKMWNELQNELQKENSKN
jgi:dsRNA-specific ribonuclease